MHFRLQSIFDDVYARHFPNYVLHHVCRQVPHFGVVVSLYYVEIDAELYISDEKTALGHDVSRCYIGRLHVF